jgi:hypothetical protein
MSSNLSGSGSESLAESSLSGSSSLDSEDSIEVRGAGFLDLLKNKQERRGFRFEQEFPNKNYFFV